MLKKIFSVIACASTILGCSDGALNSESVSIASNGEISQDKTHTICWKQFMYNNAPATHRMIIPGYTPVTSYQSCYNAGKKYPNGSIGYDVCEGMMSDTGAGPVFVTEALDFALFSYGHKPELTTQQRLAMSGLETNACGFNGVGATQYALALAQGMTTMRRHGSSIWANSITRIDRKLCTNYSTYEYKAYCYQNELDKILRAMMSYDANFSLPNYLLGGVYTENPLKPNGNTVELFWSNEDSIPSYCAQRSTNCTYGELMDFTYGLLKLSYDAYNDSNNNLADYAMKVVQRGKELAYGSPQQVGYCEVTYFKKYKFTNYPAEIWSANKVADFYASNPDFLFCGM